MKEVKIPTDYKICYESFDNKIWINKYECEQYEKLKKDNSIFKKMFFFNSKGEPIDIFSLKDIPDNSYLILKENIEEIKPEVLKNLIDCQIYKDEIDLTIPNICGIWYYNLYNKFSIRYGRWKKLSIKEFESQISYCHEKINFIKKLYQHIENK